jgi:hypothetical protein
MIFMNPFSAWFKVNKEQIKSNYFKITSLDNKQLNVQLNKKAKQLWSNMTDVEKNEWKNKIEIVEEVNPQQLTKLVLKTPNVKNIAKSNKSNKSKKKTKVKKVLETVIKKSKKKHKNYKKLQ